jgi:hypothetical protein
MIKICLTGAIAKLSLDRSRSLLTLVEKLQEEHGIISENEALEKLMERSKYTIVMENIISKT